MGFAALKMIANLGRRDGLRTQIIELLLCIKIKNIAMNVGRNYSVVDSLPHWSIWRYGYDAPIGTKSNYDQKSPKYLDRGESITMTTFGSKRTLMAVFK